VIRDVVSEECACHAISPADSFHHVRIVLLDNLFGILTG
jgi:hypothetical protein